MGSVWLVVWTLSSASWPVFSETVQLPYYEHHNFVDANYLPEGSADDDGFEHWFNIFNEDDGKFKAYISGTFKKPLTPERKSSYMRAPYMGNSYFRRPYPPTRPPYARRPLPSSYIYTKSRPGLQNYQGPIIPVLPYYEPAYQESDPVRVYSFRKQLPPKLFEIISKIRRIKQEKRKTEREREGLLEKRKESYELPKASPSSEHITPHLEYGQKIPTTKGPNEGQEDFKPYMYVIEIVHNYNDETDSPRTYRSYGQDEISPSAASYSNSHRPEGYHLPPRLISEDVHKKVEIFIEEGDETEAYEHKGFENFEEFFKEYMRWQDSVGKKKKERTEENGYQESKDKYQKVCPEDKRGENLRAAESIDRPKQGFTPKTHLYPETDEPKSISKEWFRNFFKMLRKEKFGEARKKFEDIKNMFLF